MTDGDAKQLSRQTPRLSDDDFEFSLGDELGKPRS